MDLESFEDVRPDLESLEGSHRLGRRSFLIGALAAGAAVAAPVNYAALARKRRIPMAKHAKFDVGVASGFPRPRGIEVWTRLGDIKRTSQLRLLVATDRKFGNVVEEKVVTARKDRDFTARTFVKGLKPDRHYFYRFVTEHSKSPVGRFKTAPPLDSRKPVRIAFYSCQHYESGFYNAQRAIAKERDLDLVLCLGDYIYETGGGSGVRGDTSGDNHDGDTQLLREYWSKYRLYKSDKDLQAMHAAHPFLSTWDDHEVENNYADGQPSSSQNDPARTQPGAPRRVSFAQRQTNGYRAFFNYMPRIRFKGDRRRIFEGYRLGRLVDLLLTDERQYRDRQPCNDQQLDLSGCPEADSPRTMLGANQLDWFLRNLKDSPATWKVWGTQLMVMATRLPGGVPAQVDAWDGYGYERKRILDFILDNNIQNVAAITGDIHTFFAGTAYTTGDQSTGRAALPEFVGGSATSLGLPEATDLSPEVLTLLAAVNPHISFYDFVKRGYGVIELGPAEAVCELKAVDALHQGTSTPTTIARFRVPLGARSPERIG
ncbi:MAG TPA: alkaline phosphatase D family protein [Solirubrobacterales bacterium]|nr:alkaline phosphatase D family protein [Solirubrobacterales bacterium]